MCRTVIEFHIEQQISEGHKRQEMINISSIEFALPERVSRCSLIRFDFEPPPELKVLAIRLSLAPLPIDGQFLQMSGQMVRTFMSNHPLELHFPNTNRFHIGRYIGCEGIGV
jgi:hypothetical protein